MNTIKTGLGLTYVPKSVNYDDVDLAGITWRNGNKVLILGVGAAGSTITKRTIIGHEHIMVSNFEDGWKWFCSESQGLL